jgi:hypothetical protein
MLGIVTAFVLLAEAMVAIAFAHNWQLSWWEWHLLMAIAFGVVVYSARVEAAREGTGDHVFDGLALEETVRRIDEQYDAAVRTLVRSCAGGRRAARSRSASWSVVSPAATSWAAGNRACSDGRPARSTRSLSTRRPRRPAPAGGWRHRTGRPGSACHRQGANRHRRSRRHGCR